MTQLLQQVVAILVYPGALTLLLIGLGAEVGAAWVLAPERAGLIPVTRALLAGLLPAPRLGWTLPPLAGAGVLMALLASTQVAIPFNPLPPADRNLLVAMMALVGTAWITWTWGWHRRAADPRLMLVVQFAWLVALLAPAVVQENLRPQVLGAVLVPALLPVKVSAAILYLLCLPALLQLLPETAPQGLPGASGPGRPSLEQAGFGALRGLLWLPYCGLFASLYFPPSGDEVLGVLRFLLIALGAAAIAVSLAARLVRRAAGSTRTLYLRVVGPFALFTLAVSVLSALLESHT